MGISTAIGSERISRVSGYKLNKGFFGNQTPNLPQQVVILGEANTANQGTIVTTPVQITTADQAGRIYGYGSPIHQIARILHPISGNGIGGIPVVVMAQLSDNGETNTVIVWSITGVASASVTHQMIINGRSNVDLKSYNVNIVVGDTPAVIVVKYANAINAVLGTPVLATQSSTAGTAATSSVLFSATSLTAGQTVTLAGLTYTSTGTTTQAQLAAAFASLTAGATTGAGTGTGTYTGTLTGFNTGTVTSNTVVFTTTTNGVSPAGYPVVQSGTGASATITNTAGTNGTGTLTLTTKWKGLTSSEVSSLVNINGNSGGVTYAITSTTPGTGSPDIGAALAQFEDTWYTSIINSYGIATLSALESVNGVPNPTPTGRYSATIFKPFMAFFGSTISVSADLVAITNANARVDQLTNVCCVAPGSDGFPWEAAANVVTLFARVSQDTPHLTVAGLLYPDMPVPSTNTIGDMSIYDNRDMLKKNGCSTVTLVNGAYQIQDLVTTYHTIGENPLLFSEARYLNLDWNIRDGYGILENLYVKDHVLVQDNQIVDVQRAIKPKEWKAALYDYFDYLGTIALINNPGFSKGTLQVEIDSINPNRFNTTFNYKRTGTAEIESTDVAVGF